MILGGLVFGIAFAVGSTRLLESLPYGVAPLDAATFAGVAAVLLVGALAAIYAPGRQAIRGNAVAVLHTE